MEASESDGAAGPLPREVWGTLYTRNDFVLAFFVPAAAAAWHLLV